MQLCPLLLGHYASVNPRACCMRPSWEWLPEAEQSNVNYIAVLDDFRIENGANFRLIHLQCGHHRDQISNQRPYSWYYLSLISGMCFNYLLDHFRYILKIFINYQGCCMTSKGHYDMHKSVHTSRKNGSNSHPKSKVSILRE